MDKVRYLFTVKEVDSGLFSFITAQEDEIHDYTLSNKWEYAFILTLFENRYAFRFSCISTSEVLNAPNINGNGYLVSLGEFTSMMDNLILSQYQGISYDDILKYESVIKEKFEACLDEYRRNNIENMLVDIDPECLTKVRKLNNDELSKLLNCRVNFEESYYLAALETENSSYESAICNASCDKVFYMKYVDKYTLYILCHLDDELSYKLDINDKEKFFENPEEVFDIYEAFLRRVMGGAYDDIVKEEISGHTTEEIRC